MAYAVGVARDQLWFRQNGSDLKVSIIGTGTALIIDEWYAFPDNHVARFILANGARLLDGQVQNLVNAMAGMTPPPIGQTQLTTQQHQQLDSVIAANWQTS